MFLKELNLELPLSEQYRKLNHLPGFSLLQSTDDKRGRYDILSARPYDSLQIQADDTNWEKKLWEFEALIPQTESMVDLPFQGGVIGYLSYDIGLKFSGLQTKQQQLTPGPMINLGLFDWALIHDHQKQQSYLFAAMRDENTKKTIDEVLSILESDKAPDLKMEFNKKFEPLISREEYQRNFESIQQDLKKGRCYQVNYTQPFVADFTGNSWAFYENMVTLNPVPFAAYLRGERENILSFSPERFLLVDDRDMLTSPIKGTAPRSEKLEEDIKNRQGLEQCPKNRAENVMIVDLMRNDLGKIAEAGSVEVSALFDVQSFNGVHHLVSDVRARLGDDISLFKALLSCFPAGSITGAPKREAMKVITEVEPYQRGVYCGSIGYISAHGRMDFNVAIRTVTDYNRQLFLPVGGGIVLDSEADSEYRECLTKISAIIYGYQKNKNIKLPFSGCDTQRITEQ